MADLTTALLAFLGAGGLISLGVRRYVRFGFQRRLDRRLLLADMTMTAAAFEITLDAISDAIGCAPPGPEVHSVAILLRGAFLVGSLALVITFPADERAERAAAKERRT